MKKTLAMLIVLALCLAPLCAAQASGHAYSSLANSQQILRRGDRGSDVRRLQQRLSNLGYLNGKVDGSYGAKTEQAVRAFQQKNGISVSGVATMFTQAALYGSDALNAWNNNSRPNTGTGNYDIRNPSVRFYGNTMDITFDVVNRDSQNLEAICLYYWLDTGNGRLVTIQNYKYWRQWYYGMNIPSGGTRTVSLSLTPNNSELKKAHLLKAIVGEIGYTNGSIIISMNATKQPFENSSYIIEGWD